MSLEDIKIVNMTCDIFEHDHKKKPEDFLYLVCGSDKCIV